MQPVPMVHIRICCPNSVVEGWEKAILDIFPDSVIAKKTFTPDWIKAASNETRINGTSSIAPLKKGGWGDLNSHNQPDNPQYLILNYQMFQQPNSANWVRTLINNQQIDFIVIDEIHYTKQRQLEDISKRKQLISVLTTAAAERNPDYNYADIDSFHNMSNKATRYH